LEALTGLMTLMTSLATILKQKGMKYYILTLFLTSLIGKSLSQPPHDDLKQNELLRRNGIMKLLKFESMSADETLPVLVFCIWWSKLCRFYIFEWFDWPQFSWRYSS